MRIIFDQGTHAPLRRVLSAHSADLAFELGWATLKNGELVRAANASGYAALLTTDKNFRHQQNLSGVRLSVVVLPTTSWPKLQSMSQRIVAAFDALPIGAIVEISIV